MKQANATHEHEVRPKLIVFGKVSARLTWFESYKTVAQQYDEKMLDIIQSKAQRS